MRLFEFIGLPGSGKSSFFPSIKKFIQDQNCVVYDDKSIFLSHRQYYIPNTCLQKGFSYLPPSTQYSAFRLINKIWHIEESLKDQFRATHPDLTATILGMLETKSMPDHHRKLMYKWTLNLLAVYQMACSGSTKDSILMLDEGFSQKAITYFNSDSEPRIATSLIADYISQIPKIETLINIETDKNECYERIVKRKLPKRLKDSKKENILGYLERAKEIIDIVIPALEKKGTRIIKIKNYKNNFRFNNIESLFDKKISAIL